MKICCLDATVTGRSLEIGGILFDCKMKFAIIPTMKQLKAILELLPRKTLAVMFACLFMLQGMGVFHAAMADNMKSQETSFGSNIDTNANVTVQSSHCDKMANDTGPLGGHCSHVGFCPLCSLAGWDAEAITKPAKTDVIEIISLQSLAEAPIVVEIDPALLQTSVGIERTYSIIAPPLRA